MRSNNFILLKVSQTLTKKLNPLKFNFSKLSRIQKFSLPKRPTQEELSKRKPDQYEIKMHPKNLDDADPRILPRYGKNYSLQASKSLHQDLYKSSRSLPADSPKDSRYQRVTVMGLPNSGKSSLVNALTGNYISAVSSKAHTTVEGTPAFMTDEDSKTQIELVDTPGLLKPYGNSKVSNNDAWTFVDRSDKAIMVVDCVRKPTQELIKIIRELKKRDKSTETQAEDSLNLDDIEKQASNDFFDNTEGKELLDKDTEEQMLKTFMQVALNQQQSQEKIPVILVFNKIDICSNKRKLIEFKHELEDIMHFEEVFLTSCQTGFGIKELRDHLNQNCQRARWRANLICQSEHSEAEIIEEMGREAVYEVYYKDFPHKVGVQLMSLTNQLDGSLKVTLGLKMNRYNHQKILYGQKASNIEKLTNILQEKMSERFGCPVDVFIMPKYDVRPMKYINAANQIVTHLMDDDQILEQQRKDILQQKQEMGKQIVPSTIMKSFVQKLTGLKGKNRS